MYRELRQAALDMEAMVQLSQVKPQVTDAKDAKEYEYRGGKIVFQNVSFAYDKDTREILHDLSFEIPSGKSVAIVGGSGSGKSTILRLLYRFFDASSGRILYDDQDIRSLKLSSLRKFISVVPQDTVLFNESLYYNISYGDLSASKQRVEEVCRLAQLDQFVASLPKGYDTIVGERGLKLSGGEKQRVAIARCLLKDAPIVLLDEVTFMTIKVFPHALNITLGDFFSGHHHGALRSGSHSIPRKIENSCYHRSPAVDRAECGPDCCPRQRLRG